MTIISLLKNQQKNSKDNLNVQEKIQKHIYGFQYQLKMIKEKNTK